ncbi:MAG: hypothetical protein K2K31_01325 [Clostridia bacterium]|nr:hypothetical protein [Clostridia bacterium]
MVNLKYLQKIIEKEAPEQKGKIITCKTLEMLFKSVFEDTKFVFHSGIIKDDCIYLLGYRISLNESKSSGAYFDPSFAVNDYGIVKISNDIGFYNSINEVMREVVISSLKQNFGRDEAQNYVHDYYMSKLDASKDDKNGPEKKY